MEAFFEQLIVRAVPVALPAFFVIALLVHWGVLPDGTEGKSKKDSGGGKSKKSNSKAESDSKQEEGE